MTTAAPEGGERSEARFHDTGAEPSCGPTVADTGLTA
jgi:hypothetical protein